MKRFLKIFVPILLSLCIIAGTGWYLFSYDREFTRDILLSGARFFRNHDNLSLSAWFYDRAYDQGQGPQQDAITIEKAQQYLNHNNFTKAELTLTNAIKDGAGTEVYIALSSTFVRQNKILDAVRLLDSVSNPAIKEELDRLRPPAPTVSHQPDQTYHELISVSVNSSKGSSLYVSTNGEYPSSDTDRYSGPISLAEGYTNMQAVAVAENGLVSPLASYGFTIVGVIEAANISDAAMDQAIRSGLGLTRSHKILTSDLWKITQFSVPEEARDYRALAHMIYLESLTVTSGVSGQLSHLKDIQGLKSLTVTDTSLSSEDIEAIGSLHSLERLTLEGCSLSTSAPLSNLTSLKYLNLNNNAIGNISAITAMAELTELHLRRNALRDLSALSNAGKLTRLDISYNSITGISVLSNLSALTHLDISYNQISDISPLSSCRSLKEFKGNNNQLSDISALGQCRALEHVNLSNNAISSINSLSSIPSITYLNFASNDVTELPAFARSCQLITIDGSYNKIKSLAPLSGLENLNNILMDYNVDIQSVDELASCPVLIQVNVFGTKVSDVSKLTEQSIKVNYNPIEAMEN